MSIKLLFEQLENIRKHTQVPLIMMGYLNPIYRFGFEKFCQQCHKVGIDGLIIPDLPADDIRAEYGEIMERYNLKNIMLISPNTSDERIRQIDALSSGFIYMVSSASTTGVKSGVSDAQVSYFKRIKEMKLDNPSVIGFGISDKESFEQATTFANGAIIGSAFIRHLEQSESIEKTISEFVKSVRS